MSRQGLLLVVIGVLVLFVGAFAFTDSAVKGDSSVVLQVGNLTCGACIEKIKGVLSPLAGIAGVEVDLATGRTRVSYDGARTDAATIADRIGRAGYPVVADSVGLAAPVAGEVRCPAAKPVTKSGCGGSCCG